MEATVSAHMGDVFEGGADLTILPCGTTPSWTPAVERWIVQYELPTPKQLMPQMRLSDVTPLAPFLKGQDITKWVCYGASVRGGQTTKISIQKLGENIGIITRMETKIKIIESVLFGTGHGRLNDIPAALALARGFKKTADSAAHLRIHLHGAQRCIEVQKAISSPFLYRLPNFIRPGFEWIFDILRKKYFG